jgi:hypothetical protein
VYCFVDALIKHRQMTRDIGLRLRPILHHRRDERELSHEGLLCGVHAGHLLLVAVRLM